ncbi:MAG TPA: SLBB domain-containing protein [Gemmatimonadaceae bacterium]|nr:SLBB domain-containing protein [Gemmatimonadaceae bacterium]
MLQSNPAILEQLKQRILSSGLTPEQVRSRLTAEGYPANLLDAYLPGGAGETESTAPTSTVFSALAQLGIADTTDLQLIRCGIDADTLGLTDTATVIGPRDSAIIRLRRQALFDQARQRCLAGDMAQRSQAEIDSGFVIFGMDFFRRVSTQFDPNLSGPVDPNYRIGPGDRLVLVLTGDVEQAYTLDVTREGFIVIPQVGQVWVNNLTLAELENVLYTRLGRVYSGVRRGAGATTHFYVTPARLRSNQVFVTGDAMRPGSYRISSAGTALTALYAAHGPTDNGSLRNIEIHRASGEVVPFDVYNYLLGGNATQDVRLDNNDRIFIPIHGPRVRILGEIARPATYEMKGNETLADAIRFAGGFTATASRRRVQIERILSPTEREQGGRDRIVTDVTSNEFAMGTGPALPIHAGDVIRVFPVAERVRNRVTVRGDVWSPGPVGIASGMKISDVLRLAGGVKPDAYLGEISITRLRPDSTRVQLRAALRDTTGVVVNDFPVQEDDEIRVFSRTDFRPTRYVAISGAVQRGGQFPYREGMTVRDLVLLAGGLEQSAYLNEAEIARLPENRANGVTARTFRIPLDSSYIFERTPDGRYLGPPGLPAPSGPHEEVEVKPYDNVLILRQPNWELQRTVVIDGEVKYPGRYSLRTKTERLSDLITRAGGLTSDAYANGVAFFRQNGIGRIGIELPDVLKNPKDLDNLPLQDGDSIYIPRYNAVVNVRGAVNSPIAVTYSPGASIDYYIRAAGGGTKKADLRRAYVTQPNGKVQSRTPHFLLPDGVPKPAAGSSVFVPERDASDRGFDFATSAGTIAQIAAALATLLIAVRR